MNFTHFIHTPSCLPRYPKAPPARSLLDELRPSFSSACGSLMSSESTSACKNHGTHHGILPQTSPRMTASKLDHGKSSLFLVYWDDLYPILKIYLYGNIITFTKIPYHLFLVNQEFPLCNVPRPVQRTRLAHKGDPRCLGSGR